MVSSSKAMKVFIKNRYRNKKKALEEGRGFPKHECSHAQKMAINFLIIAQEICINIGEIFNQYYVTNKEKRC